MATAVCDHYLRRCSFVTPCCDKVYRCRFCHNDEEEHELERSHVTELVCAQCTERQPIAERCRACSIRFGMYTCLECRLFDDVDKKQFHCAACGTCRVGGAENFFHCDNCDICLKLNLRDSHRCREDGGKDRCPVCFDYIHTAAEPSYVPQCGHLIHWKCYSMILKFHHRKCPICTLPYDGVAPPAANTDRPEDNQQGFQLVGGDNDEAVLDMDDAEIQQFIGQMVQLALQPDAAQQGAANQFGYAMIVDGPAGLNFAAGGLVGTMQFVHALASGEINIAAVSNSEILHAIGQLMTFTIEEQENEPPQVELMQQIIALADGREVGDTPANAQILVQIQQLIEVAHILDDGNQDPVHAGENQDPDLEQAGENQEHDDNQPDGI